MNLFLDYCSGLRNSLVNVATYTTTKSETNENKKVPVSPAALDFCYDCMNDFCVNTTEDISDWLIMERIHQNQFKRKFYFCKKECFQEWLEECRLLGFVDNYTLVPFSERTSISTSSRAIASTSERLFSK